MFTSAALQTMLEFKGASLAQANSWPDNPSEFGPDMEAKQKLKNMPKQVQDEYAFWSDLAKRGYKVPTDGKKFPQEAGRWQRAVKNPEVGDAYNMVKGDAAKAEFRK
eukprot:9473847-Pyramimonas_sp.AAC.1